MEGGSYAAGANLFIDPGEGKRAGIDRIAATVKLLAGTRTGGAKQGEERRREERLGRMPFSVA